MLQRLSRTVLALALLALPSWAEAQGTPMPFVRQQFFDDDGNPCAGCLLNVYAAGTTTRIDTYSVITLTVGMENMNPVEMDSAGRPTSGYIYLSSTSYRFVLTDSTGGITYWDADNTPSIPTTVLGLDVSGQTAGETLAMGDVVYLSDGSGALTAGRWYHTHNDVAYASSLAGTIGIASAAIGAGNTGTIRIGGRATGLGGLTPGTVYYVAATPGTLASSPGALTRMVGTADTTSSLVFVDGPQHVLPTVLTETAMYTVATTDGEQVLVKADGTSAGFTVGLYTAVGNSGKRVTVKKIDASAAHVITIDPNASETIDGATTATLNSLNELIALQSDGANWQVIARGPPSFLGAQGRLTLTTGTPVTTGDVTGATTVFYTPYVGSRIALYDGTAVWNVRYFSELSLSISTCTASTPYDVFVFDNAGAPALEMLAWTSKTARATALVQQDGVYVKSGVTTRLFVGSFYCNSSGGQTDDSFAKRNVWNEYNRVARPMRRIETTTSWTYASSTLRQANASTSNQLEVMVGLNEDGISVTVDASVQSNVIGDYPEVTIGLDATNARATGVVMGLAREQAANAEVNAHAALSTFPGLGLHDFTWLESTTANTMTVTSNSSAAQSGIYGMWKN